MTPLIAALNSRAIHAYETEDASALPGLRRFGAVMSLHGIAMNGGLVGGGIENLLCDDLGRTMADRGHAIDDAIKGFEWLGLTDVAGLVGRARDEYLRFRPLGYWEEISDEDVIIWDELDTTWFALATDERVEKAVSDRLQEIAPELSP